MRILVTGAGGLLGSAVVEAARRRGHDILAGVRPGGSPSPVPEWTVEFDVTDAEGVRRVVTDVAPAAIAHCAAYTDVDGAEAEPHEAMAVNVDGTRTVALSAAETDAVLLYPSTDYVFDGQKPDPYEPDDPMRPINAYGRSKKAGEETVRKSAGRWLVVRTSWLYGGGGDNFVDGILDRAWQEEAVRVVNDQTGRPTWTGSLGSAMVELLEAGAEGEVLHLADRDVATWYDLAREAYRLAGVSTPILPIPSEDWPSAARRPRNSVLDLASGEERLGREMPGWKNSLRRYLEGRE